MAAFAAKTFPTAHYALFRPSYPRALYTEILLPYHCGQRHMLVDLGCGPGTVTRPLSRHFARTVGTDPSAAMLATARSLTPEAGYPGVAFQASPAEHLPFLADGEADMAVAGLAAHFFPAAEWWAEMARVVRPGGTVAVWGYCNPVFPQLPHATALLHRFGHAHESDEWWAVGDYWSQPGRAIVEGLYRDVRPPVPGWHDVRRIEFRPSVAGSEEESEVHGRGSEEVERADKPLVRAELALGALAAFLRTWSSVHAWQQAHPGAVSLDRGGPPPGDAVDVFLDRLVRLEGWAAGVGDDGWKERVVEVAWAHAIVLARRD